MSGAPDTPGFAPDDPSDSRPLSDWKTRYPDPIAQRAIRVEALYLALNLLAIPILLFLIWTSAPARWLDVAPNRYPTLARYSYAWLGGTLGGTLFSIKWLYHSVAKEIWNQDRRLWRVFTPHLSAGLAFAVTVLAASDLIPFIDLRRTASPAATVGVAFLVGYFSDNATATLARIANRVFGERHATASGRARTPEPHERDKQDPGEPSPPHNGEE